MGYGSGLGWSHRGNPAHYWSLSHGCRSPSWQVGGSCGSCAGDRVPTEGSKARIGPWLGEGSCQATPRGSPLIRFIAFVRVAPSLGGRSSIGEADRDGSSRFVVG